MTQVYCVLKIQVSQEQKASIDNNMRFVMTGEHEKSYKRAKESENARQML
jgi:hypothetical protein